MVQAEPPFSRRRKEAECLKGSCTTVMRADAGFPIEGFELKGQVARSTET